MALWLCVCDYIIKILIIKQENENLWEKYRTNGNENKTKKKKGSWIFTFN